MAITLQSHQVDIHAYADGLRKELNEAECLYDWATAQLDLTTWTTENGLWKAEVLLTYGGPTVTIEIDSRYTFGTLRHSWGANSTTGETQSSIEFEHSGLRGTIRGMRGLE